MKEGRVERRLAAILAADVAGYSRLMGHDEAGTLARLKELRRDLIDPKIADHKGRIVKTTGDGLLIEFPSVVEAVACAIGVQRGIPAHAAAIGKDGRIAFRVGINLGDVIVEDGDIHGDGVNVAARLEALAEPGGICVSSVVHDQVQDRLDCDFDDMGEQALKNIARTVRVYRVRQGTATDAPPPPLPDKPSLVVLPFQNMSGDPEQEYFADGMVEEITTAIARLPWLFVIARNSAFTYKGKAIDVKQVARELGVRYVLEGSVRKGGNRVRITGQLIDTASGAHIWADRFDGALDDVFELQDQVASSVAGAIEPRLRQSEIERARQKPTASLGAYDLYLRALAIAYPGGANAYRQAIELLRQALAIDPRYAPAAGKIASIRSIQSTTEVRLTDEEAEEALALARRAIDLGRDDPDSLWMGGSALALLDGEHGPALQAVERALTLNPNCGVAWSHCAMIHCFAFRPQPALNAVDRAMRLSPLDPATAYFCWTKGYALMLAGRYEEALEWIARCLHDRPKHHAATRGRIAVLGYLGRTEEAKDWIARILSLNPEHTITWFNAFGRKFLSPPTLAVWIEGLRLAGLPEA